MQKTNYIFEVKKYIEDMHSESLVDVQFKTKDGYKMLKFIFEYDTLYGTSRTDITIHDFASEVIVQYFNHKNSVLRTKIRKLCNVILDEIIPRWFPELYISFSFRKIKFQG